MTTETQNNPPTDPNPASARSFRHALITIVIVMAALAALALMGVEPKALAAIGTATAAIVIAVGHYQSAELDQ